MLRLVNSEKTAPRISKRFTEGIDEHGELEGVKEPGLLTISQQPGRAKPSGVVNIF